MKNKKGIIALLVIVGVTLTSLVVVGTFFMIKGTDFGVKLENVEKDARVSHHIEDSWLLAEDHNEDLQAMLFYPKDLSKHTFSIYVKDQENSRYSYSSGGGLGEIAEEVAEIDINERNSRMFMSMNSAKAVRAEVVFQNSVKTIDIDPNKPFCFIISDKSSEVKIYDGNNNCLSTY